MKDFQILDITCLLFHHYLLLYIFYGWYNPQVTGHRSQVTGHILKIEILSYII